MIPFSVLDLSPIVEGGSATEAFARTLDLARHAEGWGYRLHWLAEHHNMPGIASAATAVVIGHVAGGTRTIRVGAGGIICCKCQKWSTFAAAQDRRQPLGIALSSMRKPSGIHGYSCAKLCTSGPATRR